MSGIRLWIFFPIENWETPTHLSRKRTRSTLGIRKLIITIRSKIERSKILEVRMPARKCLL